MTIGCGAAASVVEVNDALIWLDNRGYLVQSTPSAIVRDSSSTYELKILSDDALANEILSYSRWDDAIGCTYNDRGHILTQFTFPTARKTWVYDQMTQRIHERAYINPTYGTSQEHLIQHTATYRTLTVCGGLVDGKIYLMGPEYLDDNGQFIRRLRTTAVLNTEFKQMGIDCLEIRMQTGAAPQADPTDIPYIMMRYSNDGGHTWSNESLRSIGQVGEYAKRIQWYRLGVGTEWVFEFSLTEAIKFSIISAAITTSEIEK
jgi:hypothetical protein